MKENTSKINRLAADVKSAREKLRLIAASTTENNAEWMRVQADVQTNEQVLHNIPVIKSRIQAKLERLNCEYTATAKILNDLEIELGNARRLVYYAEQNLALLHDPNFDRSEFSDGYLTRVRSEAEQILREYC